MKRTQTEWEESKKKKKRLLESSDEESEEEDENERANERRDQCAVTTSFKTSSREFQVNEANEPSGMKQAGLSRTVGEKRQNSEEATRRSTRKRKGVDKRSGVMIHRVEYN